MKVPSGVPAAHSFKTFLIRKARTDWSTVTAAQAKQHNDQLMSQLGTTVMQVVDVLGTVEENLKAFQDQNQQGR